MSWQKLSEKGWPASGHEFWVYGPGLPVQAATLEYSKYRQPHCLLFYTPDQGGLPEGAVTHYQPLIRPDPPEDL